MGGGEKLEGVGRRTIIRIYHVRKKSIFNNRDRKEKRNTMIPPPKKKKLVELKHMHAYGQKPIWSEKYRFMLFLSYLNFYLVGACFGILYGTLPSLISMYVCVHACVHWGGGFLNHYLFHANLVL